MTTMAPKTRIRLRECGRCHRVGYRGFASAEAEGWVCVNETACQRRQHLTFGFHEIPNHLQLELWQFEHALARGLIPAPDLPDGRWSAALVATLDSDRIRAEVPAHPNIGAARAAELLTRTTGLDVGYADIEALAEQGPLASVAATRAGRCTTATNSIPSPTTRRPSTGCGSSSPSARRGWRRA
jgi:hypothetical protein